ncbi:MAG: hypothetical protein ACXWDI_14960 [Nocardioides sp.]
MLTGTAVLTEVPATAAPLNPCVDPDDPDNGRPAVGELSLEPSSVDVTEEPQRVTVRARLVDTGGPGAAGGVVGARITLGTPHGSDVPVDLERENGELWTGVLTVHPGSSDGTWGVRGISVIDAAGNAVGVLRSRQRDQLCRRDRPPEQVARAARSGGVRHLDVPDG